MNRTTLGLIGPKGGNIHVFLASPVSRNDILQVHIVQNQLYLDVHLDANSRLPNSKFLPLQCTYNDYKFFTLI